MAESGNSTKAGLVIALQIVDLQSFGDILKKTSLDLNKFVDPGGFNIFHDLSKVILKDYQLMPFLNLLLEEFKIRHNPSVIKEMLNSLTVKEQQTPLHLAAKFNKLKLVMEFLRLGADPAIKDSTGQTVLHLSAITGNVGIFSFFYCTLSLNIYEKDNNSYNPLHLAVMEGHENMSIFLISIYDDLNIADSKGYTPLHHSVFSSSYKIARHLVMRGANRDKRCNYEQTPEELAISRGCTDLIKVLKKPAFIGNPCKPSMKRMGRTRFFIYLITMIVKLLVISAFLLPNFRLEIAIAVVTSGLVNFFLFIFVSCKNPGYEIEKTKLAELYATIKPDFICPYCNVKKIITTVHCHHCNRCVRVMPTQKFDHHCPWINNCVGSGNHKIFIVFLCMLIIDFSASTVLGIFDCFDYETGKLHYIPNVYKINYVNVGISAFCLVIASLVFPILFIQISNCILNKTTHQKYSYKRNGVFSSLSSSSSILLKDSEDWSYSKKTDELDLDEIVEGCCTQKVKAAGISQSSNINEEIE